MKIEPTLTTITASSTSHEMSVDPVNKPQHYNAGGIEAIEHFPYRLRRSS